MDFLICICSMLLYAVLLSISALGYGRICQKVSRIGALDGVTQCVLGLDLLVVVGGVMNWFEIISWETLTLLIAGGVIAAIATTVTAAQAPHKLLPRRAWPRLLVIALAAICLSTMVYWAASPGIYPNPHDDKQSYLVFPLKMLATGSLGNEPFSERRMVSGLGGHCFLQALVLAWLPMNCIALVDPGLATVLLALAPFAMTPRRFPLAGALLAACAIVIFPPPRINTTAIMLPALQMVGLYKTLRVAPKNTNRYRLAGLYGMQLAALAAMKSTMIPYLGLWLIALTALRMLQRKPEGSLVIGLGQTSVAALMCLLPWMAASLESNGTALYPLLGRGFHRTAYAAYHVTVDTIMTSFGYGFVVLKNPLFACLLAILAAGYDWKRQGQFGAARKPLFSPEALSLGIATVGGTGAVWFAVGGVGMDRYAFSATFAALWVLAFEFYVVRSHCRISRYWRHAILYSMCGLLIGYSYSPFVADRLTWLLRATHSVFDRQQTEAASRRQMYSDLFSSVPAGQRVLARLSDPYLCDFATHSVFIADCPGMASPPPGMPVGMGGEAMAAYLLENGIRYVAYSYHDEAGFSRSDPEFRSWLAPGKNLWVATIADLTFKFQDDLSELMATRRSVNDNGEVIILDLSQRR